MAGGAGSLEQTPTWSVAVVCFVLVVISIAIEQIIHMVGKWLMKRHKVALVEALEKVKAELMLLGFISLLLTVLQNPIANICIPRKIGDSWHPCKNLAHDPPPAPAAPSDDLTAGKNRRRLLLLEQLQMLTAVGETDYHHDPSMRRFLAGKSDDKCAAKGKVPLISTNGIHELHIFIFVLAIMHIIYCITTLAFGRLKMRKWKAWERETKTAEYQFSHDPERFRFTRDTSFGRRHLDFWSKSPILIWIVCFFRQFVRSVPKVDYLTLRHGFITAHLAPSSSSKFDFQKYISRSLEKDFKVVVGISPLIWLFAVLFLLFNTHGWYSYLWLPFIPLIIILMVGTKLQVIITRMAVQIMERGDVIKGVPVVKPADRHFWFNNPKLMLHLIHFVLFENAFQLAFFVFSTYKYGINSCFHKETADVVIRITMGIIIQILCSYVTLPLYALVTQMGSNMKSTIFNERVEVALRKWHQTARRHVKESRKSGTVTPMSTSRPATPTHRLSPGQQTPAGRLSPVHLLHRYQGEMDSYQASPVQTPTHGMSPVHLLRHYQSELDSVHASSLTRNYISDEDRLDIENSITSAYYRNFEGSSHNRGGTNDGSSHNRSSESSHHLRKEGGVQQGDDQDGEIQMTGKGDDQGHVAIDFSFDKRRLM